MSRNETVTTTHTWQFNARFRRHAFGWKGTRLAIQRIKEALSEIKKVARKDTVLSAEGAVVFLERISPALEQVDSSSGAIGTAVNNAIAALVPIIANAPVDEKIRSAWLERLFAAHEDDRIPYIESLTEHWGELCASKAVASVWADRLLELTQMALSPDRSPGCCYHGTTACLSALFKAERFDELVKILEAEYFWHYKRWMIRALAAQGKKTEAIRLAEASRSPWASDWDIDQICEEILLSSSLVDEAYTRYGLRANLRGTNLATFRALAKKYPHKSDADILGDLVKSTPGDEGKWFAAAKDAGLFQEALALASRTPCDPKTLTRAARDYADSEPDFALNAGLLALYWLLQGYGYEITSADVWQAYNQTIKIAERFGKTDEAKAEIKRMASSIKLSGNLTHLTLARELGLSD